MTTNQDNTATELRPRQRRGGGDDRYIVLRNVLNIIFMVGAVVGVVVFYQCGREAGTVIILASMLFKIVECVFRFMK